MKRLASHCIRACTFFCMLLSSSSTFAGNTKLHITTDKEKYNAAEMIRFQVFLLNPSEKINNTLFIELLDCHGNRLAKQMLPFDLNISSGHINIPETGKAEFYLLYCYVNNADSMECSSIKKIFLKSDNAPQLNKGGSRINVSYFFEGGTFVAESPNNILVQCTDESENPVITKGKITNGKSNIYAVFETNELGLALITFNPEDTVRYYIEVKDKNSNEGKGIIPLAAASGVTLNTTVTPNSIIYKLFSYTGLTERIPDYRIEALYNGQIVYDAAISFQNLLSMVTQEIKQEEFLKVEKFPAAGFMTFRLTDKTNKLYAQRVVYYSFTPAQNKYISVVDTINKREATISLPDMVSGKASIEIRAGSTSAIKTDLSFLAVTEQITINDQLIATSDEPSGFNALNNEANRYLSLRGILLNHEKKPLKNKNINIILQQKNFKKQYLVTKTDREGRLQIDNLIFFDSVTVYYQLADKSEEKNDVYLDLKVIPSTQQVSKPLPGLNVFCAADLKNTDTIKADEKILKQVIVTAGKVKTDSEKFADRYVSGQMKRSEGTRNEYDFIKNPEEVDNRSLFDFIKGRIPNLKVFMDFEGTPVIRGTNGGTVGVYLNDMDIENSLNQLAGLQIKDVALIKYHSISLKPKTGLRNELTDMRGGDAGDLLIYTRQDFSPTEEKTKGLPKATVVGYTLEKKDYAPSIFPDDARSLFWKPDWNVESGQRIFMQVPAGGLKEDLEIVIEGINAFAAPYRFTQKLVFR